MIGVVHSGIGTTASVLNMLHHIGAEAEVTASPIGLNRFSHLVLPGVGHYSEGSRRLVEGGWPEPIRQFAASGKPVLGVCLGMQLLGEGSEEGEGEGLGLLPFRLERLAASARKPVPHMGWNTIVPLAAGASELSASLLATNEPARYYFVHSYAVAPDSPVAAGATNYGGPFASVVGRDNVVGVQFHPEKSHRFGMALLRNFAAAA